MKIAILLAWLVSVSVCVSARSLINPGRSLLEESVIVTPDNSTFTLEWFGIRNSRPTDQCIVNGYIPDKWTVEQGPLKVFVPQGVTAQIGINPNDDNSYVQLYSQTSNSDLQTQVGSRGNDLTGVTFTANGPVGSEAFVTGAVIRAIREPARTECAVGLWLSVAKPIEPPVEPPTEPEPTPTPTPTATTGLPKNPCYCTAGNNGGTVCFNFNQATSDINCAPTSGLNCKEGQAQAGEYTQQAGPVYFCS